MAAVSPDRNPGLPPLQIRATRRGWRLSQHGVVLSELLREPGPTHSVFDVLAAAIRLAAPPGPIALLGFAAGAVLAPLRALGVTAPVHAVDLDRRGWDCFCRLAPAWAGEVHWAEAEAAAWLARSATGWPVILEDLSVPEAGDVHKPPVSWDPLPARCHAHLALGGLLVSNLLAPRTGGWRWASRAYAPWFPRRLDIGLADFENRIWLAGAGLPPAAAAGRGLRQLLRQLGSRQAEGLSVRAGRRHEANGSPPPAKRLA